MRVNEFARHPERARQFTDGHERIVFGIDHSRQGELRRSLSGPRKPRAISVRRNLDTSALRRATRGPKPSFTLGRLDHRAARGVRSH